MHFAHSFDVLRQVINQHPQTNGSWRKEAFPCPEVLRLWQVCPACFVISASAFGGGHLSVQHFQTVPISLFRCEIEGKMSPRIRFLFSSCT
ncbi:hypothetical protein A2239_04665 [Candidatus Uhrbacteria bacterium RIFOXYA2_FULL_40_9]|nr:MAG: hypothetical protein UT94_C0040G0010 [Candidatus Uhrbacteria bacterium GW2011_GWF2_40_263]OGL93968.1 MAG: hypothetical protein A2239_04665 [Candidatus Uhrbacteria bacterium RIFOXYA2_FULL_40_9]HBK34927.1 hypothetical protein [Candidatus Uhrbacteria bacterium]HCB55354.1 hypothetical protein [Candidatus Uhrbacteria bacterium]